MTDRSELPNNQPQGPNTNGPDLYQWGGGEQQRGQAGSHGTCPEGGQTGQPDLYQYGGDGPQHQQQPGQNGNAPDLYQFGGDGQQQQHQGDAAGNDGSAPLGANWHPDYTYSSPLAKQWLSANQQTRGEALQLNPDGSYTVQFGDCLSTIAQRALQDQGDKAPTSNDLQAEEQKIIHANDSTYKSLDQYPDQLKDGWKLSIPGEQAVAQQGTDQTGTQSTAGGETRPEHQCVPNRNGHRPDVPPPPGYHARPSIENNYYVNGNVYVNQGEGNFGQLSPQNRFFSQRPGAGEQQPPMENYYGTQNGTQNGYRPSMQYQWQTPDGSAGSSYYNNSGANQYQIQPIPNYVPGSARAQMIPNATGRYQAQLINYNYNPEDTSQTYTT